MAARYRFGFGLARFAVVEEEREDEKAFYADEVVDSLHREMAALSIKGAPSATAAAALPYQQAPVSRREIADAVKFGRKERAHPAPDTGAPRWQYTHAGMVYITDETSTREITRWSLSENESSSKGLGLAAVNFTTHVCFVVDSSGSMRKSDVPGFMSRTHAVYHAILEQFYKPQFELMQTTKGIGMGKAVVTLIEMSNSPRLVVKRGDIDDLFRSTLEALMFTDGRSHGNYIPALKMVHDVLDEQASHAERIIVCFLSDGAPSDHNNGECEHGYQVWREDGFFHNGRRKLNVCGPYVRQCRAAIKDEGRRQCAQLITELGDKFGRDRVSVHTVAFGPAQEDFTVLQEMAAVLPRSSFQKLGLAAGNLVTAFTSLSSTLTSLRTEGGSHGLTLRAERPAPHAAAVQQLTHAVSTAAGWHIYTGPALVSKRSILSRDKHELANVPLSAEAVGVAVYGTPFAKGAERSAYKCTEVGPTPEAAGKAGAVQTMVAVGPSLVGKETLFEEQLKDAKFHVHMAKMHAEGSRLAHLFNARVKSVVGHGRPELTVRFVPCTIYEVLDPWYAHGRAWILAEPFLEGRFTKWNNNNGGLGADALGTSLVDQLPHVFSHFSWSVTDGSVLLCDLQGVWNRVDGFTFTDPAMHRHEGKRPQPRHGKHHKAHTDKGGKGISNFFESHRCSELCRLLGLKQFV